MELDQHTLRDLEAQDDDGFDQEMVVATQPAHSSLGARGQGVESGFAVVAGVTASTVERVGRVGHELAILDLVVVQVVVAVRVQAGMVVPAVVLSLPANQAVERFLGPGGRRSPFQTHHGSTGLDTAEADVADSPAGLFERFARRRDSAGDDEISLLVGRARAPGTGLGAVAAHEVPASRLIELVLQRTRRDLSHHQGEAFLGARVLRVEVDDVGPEASIDLRLGRGGHGEDEGQGQKGHDRAGGGVLGGHRNYLHVFVDPRACSLNGPCGGPRCARARLFGPLTVTARTRREARPIG